MPADPLLARSARSMPSPCSANDAFALLEAVPSQPKIVGEDG